MPWPYASLTKFWANRVSAPDKLGSSPSLRERDSRTIVSGMDGGFRRLARGGAAAARRENAGRKSGNNNRQKARMARLSPSHCHFSRRGFTFRDTISLSAMLGQLAATDHRHSIAGRDQCDSMDRFVTALPAAMRDSPEPARRSPGGSQPRDRAPSAARLQAGRAKRSEPPARTSAKGSVALSARSSVGGGFRLRDGELDRLHRLLGDIRIELADLRRLRNQARVR
jgi:hypothetical protein